MKEFAAYIFRKKPDVRWEDPAFVAARANDYSSFHAKRWSMAQGLGIANLPGGENLIINEYAQRLVGTWRYDQTKMLRTAANYYWRRTTLDEAERRQRTYDASLEILIEQGVELERVHFADELGATAYQIRRAVNELIARSIGETDPGRPTVINLAHEIVTQWQQSWAPRVGETLSGAPSQPIQG